MRARCAGSKGRGQLYLRAFDVAFDFVAAGPVLWDRAAVAIGVAFEVAFVAAHFGAPI
jgi:hypothetical protein